MPLYPEDIKFIFFKRRNVEDVHVRRRLQIDQKTQEGAPGQMHVFAKRTSKAI